MAQWLFELSTGVMMDPGSSRHMFKFICIVFVSNGFTQDGWIGVGTDKKIRTLCDELRKTKWECGDEAEWFWRLIRMDACWAPPCGGFYRHVQMVTTGQTQNMLDILHLAWDPALLDPSIHPSMEGLEDVEKWTHWLRLQHRLTYCTVENGWSVISPLSGHESISSSHL